MIEKEAKPSTDVAKLSSGLGYRHVIIFLLFLSTTVAYASRVSISMAIVAMTSENDYGFPVFDWDRSIQDTILSSFFWGYIVLQIPAGMIAGRFGGKIIIFIAMLVNGVVNFFVPLAAMHGGFYTVIVCRIIMGLSQGLLYPSLHGIIGQWAPVEERGRLGAYVYAGAQLGTVVEMVTAGLLSASPWGWPSIFYVAGILCLIWSILWIIFGGSSPSTCRWVSKEERKYIESSAGSVDIKDSKVKFPTPWRKIWTSVPFLCIFVCHCAQSLGFWTLLTEMPSYMKHVLEVDIKSNGVFSALPYVAMYLLSFVFSWSADFLVNRNIVSLPTSRKIFNTIALWGPACALMVLAYLPPGNLVMAVIILTITVGLNGAHYVGFLISHIDLSPNFASTLMGITNGFGNIFSILAPLSVTFVVKDESSASDWRNVFFLSAGFYFLANLLYLLFMSGEVQSWNEPPAAKHSVEAGGSKQEGETKRTETELQKY